MALPPTPAPGRRQSPHQRRNTSRSVGLWRRSHPPPLGISGRVSAWNSAALTGAGAFMVYLAIGNREVAMFEHADAVNVRIDIEANPDGVLRHIMVIETHLVTSRLVEGYNDSSITDLVQAGVQFVNDHYS